MKKQQKQLLVLAVCAAVFVGIYFAVGAISDKQAEEEQAAAEADTITICSVDSADISAISFDGAVEFLSFERDGESWVYVGDKTLDIDESVFDSLLSSFYGLTADSVLEQPNDESEYGFDSPVKTIEFTSSEGITSLTVGMENPVTGQYYLKKSGDERIFIVDSSFVSGFDVTPEDLIVVQEEEEATTDDVAAGETESETATEEVSEESSATDSETGETSELTEEEEATGEETV